MEEHKVKRKIGFKDLNNPLKWFVTLTTIYLIWEVVVLISTILLILVGLTG